MNPDPQSMPDAFGRIVTDCIEGILAHQRPDGAIEYDPAAPLAYPQQAIMPLAFAYAGLGPDRRHRHSPRLLDAICRLGDFLTHWHEADGRIHFNSWGHDVHTVDQRLVYAWVEGLRLMREAGADLPYDRWAAKILAACQHLVDHRLTKLMGVRRFISRVLGTSTNHAALYVSTIYRAGSVLNRPELCAFVLPIGRALAADIHPDGYWEEHGDLLRTGGPTPSYNYLTHGGMALLHAWTGEEVFADAIRKSTAFHEKFSYPDATFLELIDERVRHDLVATPRVWGLFGFSGSPSGRGMAKIHFTHWLKSVLDRNAIAPETLARHCENFLYWNHGPMEPAAFEKPVRCAFLALPAALFSRDGWSAGLSAMAAINPEDPAYRDNPFALDRQKLFSVWHENAGLIVDGSHSKNQPENSTFRASSSYATDYYPSGGRVYEEDGAWVAHAAYKSFFGEVRVKPLSRDQMRIVLAVDAAGNRGPFTAGFSLARRAAKIVGLNGRVVDLGDADIALTATDLGGGFVYGSITIRGPQTMRVTWPFRPFNSYAADGKSKSAAWQVRVDAQLTDQDRSAVFELAVADCGIGPEADEDASNGDLQ